MGGTRKQGGDGVLREEEAKVTENPMSCPSAQNRTALGPSLNLERGCWETFASCDYFNILILQLPKYSKDFSSSP